MCGRVGDVWPDDTRNVDYEAFQTGECMDIIGYLWMHVFCFFVCGDQNLLLPSAAHYWECMLIQARLLLFGLQLLA
jgi:hypothetical protein